MLMVMGKIVCWYIVRPLYSSCEIKILFLNIMLTTVRQLIFTAVLLLREREHVVCLLFTNLNNDIV